jgi:hypothetical protein
MSSVIRSRRSRGLLATIVGLALGAMTLTAPTANATIIQNQCEAMGGTYTSEIVKDPVTGLSHLHETCCYESLNPAVPGRECDDYYDGKDIGLIPPTTTPPKHPVAPVNPPTVAVNPPGG